MRQFWYIVEALLALARHRRSGKKPFTRMDLREWSERIGRRPRAAQIALDHLEACGLVRRGKPEGESTKQGAWTYMLTPEGRAAAIAAEEARDLEERLISALRDTGSLDARVFALLRARRALTGPEAAETLVDAGDDVKAAGKRAAACLRAWSQLFPNAIQPSAQRVAGAIRYVMVADVNPLASRAKKTTHARGGAIA